ncbi:MAG: prepilin-type N-terminal cleavage/methylation domain-containing protein [Oceanospirillales bacterium]|nr:MAG: prepilin-type N-terminal cleavage/methylation domain-containing protein [Oceanospirillales bacterium]
MKVIKYYSTGVTLIELMVAIAVMSILLTIGVPSFNNFVQNSRSTALANELVTTLNLARSEAVRRALDIRICASSNQTSCSGIWDGSNGWLVIPTGTDQTPIRAWQAPASSAVISRSGASGDIIFNSLGELTSGSTTFVTHFIGCKGDQARSININASGRISSRRVTCP